MDTLLLTCISTCANPFLLQGTTQPFCSLPWLPKQMSLEFLVLLFLTHWTNVPKRHNSEKALAKDTIWIPTEWIFVVLAVLVNWTLGKKPCSSPLSLTLKTSPSQVIRYILHLLWTLLFSFKVSKIKSAQQARGPPLLGDRGRVWQKKKG